MITKVNTKKGVSYKVTIQKMLNGKRKSLTKRFTTKKEAQTWESLQKSLMVSGVPIFNTKTDFDSVVSDWYNNCIKQKKEKTQLDYKGVINKYLLPEFSGEKIENITSDRVFRLRDRIVLMGKAPSTVNKQIGVLKQIMKYAMEMKVIHTNPCLPVKEIKHQAKEREFWDIGDIDIFSKSANNWHYYDMCMFAINTGMRLGEIASLKFQDINIKSKQIRVNTSMQFNGIIVSTKTNQARTIPMNDPTVKILKRAIKGKSNGDLIFTNEADSKINVNNFNERKIRPYLKSLGLDKVIVFHGFRHTFASHFMMNGGNIFDLQKLLGHKDIASTMVYAHLSPEHLSESIKLINFTVL